MKITQRLKEKSCYNDIKEIIFTRKMTNDRRCVFCDNLASHEAIFSVQGASLVEWYCGAHVKRNA